MIWALLNNEKIKATPNINAICPLCKGKLIAKCGEINIWHWAHKSIKDCDTFGEPESDWHSKWKSYFPKEQQEIIIDNHRADIKTKEGLIIELQNSPISSKKIKEREEFYKNMIWILNGENFKYNLNFNSYPIKWRRMPKTWKFANKLIYIDMGGDILLMNYGETDCAKFSKTAFIIEHGGKTW